MKRPARIGVAFAVAVPALLGAQLAVADSGSYEFISSFTTHYVTFEHGNETVIGGPIDGTQTISASSGGVFKVGDSSTFECLVFVKKTANGIDNESPCTSTDSSQDKMFTLARRRAGDMNTGGQGRSEILGGTGKYAGITGSCTYRATYLPGNRATTVNQCQWQKP
jgi:hypothetical protein